MRIFNVITIGGSDAQLWSDDTFTMHFGEGFEDQVESTPADLAAAVSGASLQAIIDSDNADQNDKSKAEAALMLR